MTAANLPLVIEQGALFEQVLTLRSDETGDPLVLTGCTAHMQIRPEAGSATLLHDMSTTNGGLIIDGPAGTITLRIEDETSAAFTWCRGEYDLVVTDSGGEPFRLLKGSVMIDPAVTR